MLQNNSGFKKKSFSLKSRVPNLLLKITFFAIATYFMKDDFPFVEVIFWLYASINILMLIGFWAFKRFINKKISEVSNQFQGNSRPEDEDLGEAEVVDD